MSLGSQNNWLDTKNLLDIHRQYIIRLASIGLIAKELQKIYPSEVLLG